MPRKKKTKNTDGPVVAVSSVHIKGSPIVRVLSEKETEVLQWAARGYSQKQTAAEMKIREARVESYLQNILVKLNVETIDEAILIGRDKWMID